MSERALATADLPPRNDVTVGGGRVAIAGHLELVTPPLEVPTGFRLEEIAVLSLISEGNTAVQVARKLGPEFDMGKSDVNAHRDSAMEKLGTRSIALGVHRAIKGGMISVEVKPDREVITRLRKHDAYMLNRYARGFSNHNFAKSSGTPVRSLETYHDRLLERVGAWSRPHAVRRGHELGIIS